MTDQERITDFLCSEKKMAANYDTFASECVNIPLRDEFLRLFNQSHHSQTELFQLAQERGWYSPEQAQTDKIDQDGSASCRDRGSGWMSMSGVAGA